MAAGANNKDAAMSASLKAKGYPHGRRFSRQRNEVPSMKDVGSAAYRRLMNRKGGK